MNYCMSVLHMQTIYIRVHNLKAAFFIPFIMLLNPPPPPFPQCGLCAHTLNVTADQLIFSSLSELWM